MDLKPLLIPASSLNEKAGVIKHMEQDHLLNLALDNELIKQVGGKHTHTHLNIHTHLNTHLNTSLNTH